MDHFLLRLGDQRGKTIELIPGTIDANAPCGLLVSTTTIDFVCYANNTSPLHRQHIILHEIGHLVLDHEGHRIDLKQGGLADKIMPYLDPSAIRRLLGRTVPIAGDEREAELFATLAGDRISRLVDASKGSVPRDTTVLRLRSLFDVPAPRGGHRG